ncbi:DUF1868 domain-containing protein [Dickeya fangzhongdai]|uniref:DUF1868 domain-containing protein n=1 Tax=Dickeya fangzhongdai TaxID=1778540 RepID=UPI001EFBDECC|nr:DUF1868 domain-containing protein [Dickeya fangzhongdai]ULR31614.1 DUF1868 domain-containing protein [Dickeya fangzhongdai]WES90741.1 DUF1868 domain-containing protein [Dickeya fangzhongdai]
MNPLRRRFVLQLPLLAYGMSLFANARADDTFSTMRPSGSLVPTPRDIGGKFNPDGSVRRFPGNTIISHIPLGSSASDAFTAVRDTLRQQDFSHCLTFTPPSSYHMTVFEGVTESKRRLPFWPADLPTDAPLQACTSHLVRKLAGFDLQATPPFKLRITDFNARQDSGATLRLTPLDDNEERKLRTLRDRLSERLAIRAPDHDSYGFHVTLAYLVRWMTEEESQAYLQAQQACLRYLQQQVPVLELSVPEFCVFNDMFAFDTQLKVGQPVTTVPLTV